MGDNVSIFNLYFPLLPFNCIRKINKKINKKEFHSVLKYFNKRQRELNSAKIVEKFNKKRSFLALISFNYCLNLFKCLAVFHVINKRKKNKIKRVKTKKKKKKKKKK